MPTPSKPARWRANTGLTVDRPGQTPLRFEAGDECVGAPAGWPPDWAVEQQLVTPITDSNTDTDGGK